MEKRFQRRIENFECLHCGQAVTGNGFTNHCPNCLWSRHVDDNPGDRAATCGGAMRPVAYETVRGRAMVLHRCETCGFERRNHVRPEDNMDALIRIAADAARSTARGTPGPGR
jgi:hypothetical protein